MKFYILPFFLLLILSFSPSGYTDDRMTIALRWSKAYPDDTRQNFQTAMIWSMSLLGAEMPAGTFRTAFKETETNVYELNMNLLGFSEASKKPIVTILDSLKKTEEYKVMCSIDAGRFVVLMLHAPAHYYAVSGAAETLTEFKKRHGFDTVQTKHFPVVRSSITEGNRLLTYKTGRSLPDAAFIAEEGTGRLETANFTATEYEAIDIMPNGQLRFAIYDQYGQLKSATPALLSEAGKPGKCMWCHESALQPLYMPTFHVPGHASPQAFSEEIATLNNMLRDFQASLMSDVRFLNREDHVYHEVLYVSFMEPSALRLAGEWKMPVDSVRSLLKNVPTHINYEYPWIGQLYYREDIRHFEPFRCARVPQSVREPADFEPDFNRKTIDK